mgnify:CR=1 FL=1
MPRVIRTPTAARDLDEIFDGIEILRVVDGARDYPNLFH